MGGHIDAATWWGTPEVSRCRTARAHASWCYRASRNISAPIRHNASWYWALRWSGGRVVCSLWKPAGLGGICKAVDDGLLTGLKIVSGGQTGADPAGGCARTRPIVGTARFSRVFQVSRKGSTDSTTKLSTSRCTCTAARFEHLGWNSRLS
jgi:hypothetical protein